MADRVHAPCAAYYPMAEIMGDAHMLKPTPTTGMSVVVQGRDGNYSSWAMTAIEFQRIRPLIDAHTDIVLISAKPYKNNSDLKGPQ